MRESLSSFGDIKSTVTAEGPGGEPILSIGTVIHCKARLSESFCRTKRNKLIVFNL